MSDYMITGLIKDLQSVVEEHGNLPVYLIASYGHDQYELPIDADRTVVENGETQHGHWVPKRIVVDSGL